MTGLMTLTGAGGSGKTRLALEIARGLVGVYPDGVWLVELGSLSEGELVAQAVADALRVREQPNRPLAYTLADALREKKMLLLLDNCEHLLDAAARLVDTLLGSCPRLRILATGREAIGVPGEANWPVPPLAVPDADSSPTDLMRYEAVRLFVERARLRLPSFDLTPANAQAVAEVCRRLDGIPLAIELVTGRVTALAIQQVAERIEDSLSLLISGPRAATPRHQTMRATIEWSFALLSEPEQALFNRLSVFVGGCTLEAAETVGAGDGIEKSDVLDLLGRLVDKSLLVAEPGPDSASRYRMLEPVCTYNETSGVYELALFWFNGEGTEQLWWLNKDGVGYRQSFYQEVDQLTLRTLQAQVVLLQVGMHGRTATITVARSPKAASPRFRRLLSSTRLRM
jgi:predicted ATPase